MTSVPFVPSPASRLLQSAHTGLADSKIRNPKSEIGSARTQGVKLAFPNRWSRHSLSLLPRRVVIIVMSLQGRSLTFAQTNGRNGGQSLWFGPVEYFMVESMLSLCLADATPVGPVQLPLGPYFATWKIVTILVMLLPWLYLAPKVSKDALSLRLSQTVWAALTVGAARWACCCGYCCRFSSWAWRSTWSWSSRRRRRTLSIATPTSSRRSG